MGWAHTLDSLMHSSTKSLEWCHRSTRLMHSVPLQPGCHRLKLLTAWMPIALTTLNTATPYDDSGLKDCSATNH
ncbi:hypothetical protein CesoFtcFv8_023781 [Champsocephalus esox]|uniref:Uncharacterized protein n=1 Tax=Champsocephalus esox TaxID=159716 RepID=A0AAN8B5H2_9TELE|nr:hypothetical protein CesoFtcFv8_023781 [Champsocephalus esox]